MFLQQPVGPVLFSYALGAALIYSHGWVARRLWKADQPDIISMMASSGGPPSDSPLWHKGLHLVLSKLKYVGLLFIAMGVYGTGEWVWELLTGRTY